MEDKQKGFLGKVAAISNRLPHPVTIFILLSIIVGILSVIFSKMGVGVEIEAINRSTKEVELQTFFVKIFLMKKEFDGFLNQSLKILLLSNLWQSCYFFHCFLIF